MLPLLDRVFKESILTRRVIIGILIAIASFVLYEQMHHAYRYLAGDSFTYFAMVRKFHETGTWFSYSGVDHTMGIHLGYYFLTIPLYALVGIAIPTYAFVLNLVLILLGIGFLVRAFGRTVGLIAFFGSLSTYGGVILNNGLESSLVFCTLSLFVWFVQSHVGSVRLSLQRSMLLGGLLGLLILARLDLIFLVMAFYVVFAWQRLKVFGRSATALKQTVTECIFIGLGFGIVFLLLACLNQKFNGSIVPISGRLKSSFPHPRAEAIVHLGQLKIFMAAAILLGCALLKNIVKKQSIPFFLPVLFLGSCALWIYNGVFASGIGAWYGVLPFFSVLILIGMAIEQGSTSVAMTPSFQRWVVSGMVFLLSGAIVIDHLRRDIPDWISPHQAAAAFLDERAKPGETAGELKDGVFAFYAHLPVYSLTGLANNAVYVHAVQQGLLDQYARERSLHYVISGSVASGVQVPGGELLFTHCTNPLYDHDLVQIFTMESCLNGTNSSSRPAVPPQSP